MTILVDFFVWLWVNIKMPLKYNVKIQQASVHGELKHIDLKFKQELLSYMSVSF